MGRSSWHIQMEQQIRPLTNPPFTGNVQGICPSGWHIPTYAEFQTLECNMMATH